MDIIRPLYKLQRQARLQSGEKRPVPLPDPNLWNTMIHDLSSDVARSMISFLDTDSTTPVVCDAEYFYRLVPKCPSLEKVPPIPLALLLERHT